MPLQAVSEIFRCAATKIEPERLETAVPTNRETSFDNALAESVIGLFKAEVAKRLDPWKTVGEVEWNPLKWVLAQQRGIARGQRYRSPNDKKDAFHQQQNGFENADQALNKDPLENLAVSLL